MFLDVLKGIMSLANVFIALFIVIYAMLFLKQTKSHKERRPWDYLVVGSFIYIVYTVIIMLLSLYNVGIVFNLSLNELTVFFQFIYSALVLLAFISQTDLIFKNELIIITRKLSKEDRNAILEARKKEEENRNKPAEK